MAYSIKELLANNNTIQRMSLLEIYSKYGARDLLSDEIKRRVVSNIEEVRDFYKNHNPNAYIGDYRKNLNDLSNLLKLSPVELLDWKCFLEINNNIAKEYLDSDTSWLNYKNIPKKVSKSFLLETLLKNNNLYKHSELIELLSDIEIMTILSSDQIDFSKIPNIINIINSSIIGSSDLQKIMLKLCVEKKYNLLSQLLSLDKFKPGEIEPLIIQFQNSISFNEFLNVLNSLPSNIIQYINQNSYFFEKVIKMYINDQEKIERILNSTFALNLSKELIKKLLVNLSYNKRFDMLITNNNYYELLKDEIDLKDFLNYFNDNVDNCLNLLTKSNLIFDFLKDSECYHIINENIANKCYQYIFNNIESLKFCFINQIEIGNKNNTIKYIYDDETSLNLVQQDNIANSFNEISRLDIEEIFKIFDKYSYIKEKVVGSEKFEQFLKNGSNGYPINYIPKIIDYLFPVLDRYPEVIDIMDFDLITVLNSPIIMKNLDKYPKVEKLLMNNNKFLSYILSDEHSILKFMPLINKYNISNETIKLFNNSFKKLQEVRPELSWGNSSLRKEMLSEKFINILDADYIDAILAFDSEASDIVVNMYHQNKLGDLKQWLDYSSKNISGNHRMIHYYIMSYDKMEDLINELVKTNYKLNDYEIIILEEIIDNENLYNIKSLEELDNYFEIKANKILENKEEITNDEACEIFFNTSSLQNGVPWKLDFTLSNINLDYIKYKYVRTGVLTEEEFEYLQKIKSVLSNKVHDNYYDTEMIRGIVKKFTDKNVPTARSIINKIRAASAKEFNSKLLDLDELRKIASYDDPSAQVYIEIKDGIEYIHLNGYDFKCMVCTIFSNGIKSTFSHEFNYSFEQYTVLSEKIKEEKGNQNLGKFSLASLIDENPENWNLIEGISTISSGLSSSRHSYSGFGWGRKSNIDVIGTAGLDAAVSHKIRNLKPNNTDWPLKTRSLFGTDRGEYWFDRTGVNNERIQPEFIMDDEGYAQGFAHHYEKAAKYFGIPIVIRHGKFYDDNYENRLDSAAREKFLETFNIDVIEDILFNHKNKDDNEKINFIINSLRNGFETNVLDYQDYISKLTQLKWKLYEIGFTEQFEIVNSFISELSNNDFYVSFEQAQAEFESLTEEERRRQMIEEELRKKEGLQQETSHIR